MSRGDDDMRADVFSELRKRTETCMMLGTRPATTRMTTTTETDLGCHGDEPVGRDVRQEALVPAVVHAAAVQEDGDGVDAGVGGGDHHERLGDAGDLAVVDVLHVDAMRPPLEHRPADGHRRCHISGPLL